MICKNCGADVANSKFCTVCGAPMEAPAPVATPYTNDVAVEAPKPATDPGKTLGIVSLALGIAALLLGSLCSCLLACLGGFVPALLAIGAIITGVLAMKKSKEAGFKNTMALIGCILGGVSIAVILVFVLINAIIGGINGYNQATNYYY